MYCVKTPVSAKHSSQCQETSDGKHAAGGKLEALSAFDMKSQVVDGIYVFRKLLVVGLETLISFSARQLRVDSSYLVSFYYFLESGLVDLLWRLTNRRQPPRCKGLPESLRVLGKISGFLLDVLLHCRCFKHFSKIFQHFAKARYKSHKNYTYVRTQKPPKD